MQNGCRLFPLLDVVQSSVEADENFFIGNILDPPSLFSGTTVFFCLDITLDFYLHLAIVSLHSNSILSRMKVWEQMKNFLK